MVERHALLHEWEEKVWGRVMHPLSSSSIAISCLEVKTGEQSSRHSHFEKTNTFVVVTGSLRIVKWDKDGYYTDTILTSGQSYTIPAGVDHRFHVLESGIVVEYYTADNDACIVRQCDIRRVNQEVEA